MAFGRPTKRLINIYTNYQYTEKLVCENIKSPENCTQTCDVQGDEWSFFILIEDYLLSNI